MNVLIVEDEPLTLDRMVDLTRSYAGCSLVTPCSSPAEALAAFESTHYDVALLDIQLPDMSGLDLASHLQNYKPGISVIFVTAYNHFAAEAFDLEAQDYLLKPVREERLHRALDKVSMLRTPDLLSDSNKDVLISIQAFNYFSVSVAGQPVNWRRRKAAELFAYLLNRPERTASKYQLCDALWPEQDGEKAQVYLQTVIYQLRQNLQSLNRDQVLIRYFDQKYQLVLKDHHYDVEIFEHVTSNRKSLLVPRYDDLKALVLKYGDGYLAHEDWPWIVSRQSFLAARYTRLLEFLIERAGEKGEVADITVFSDRLRQLQG